MNKDSRSKPEPRPRAAYRRFESLDTRWADNDVYGHVNNVQYYAFFDTAVNRMMIATGLLDPLQGKAIALVVETRCSYRAPVSFPDRLQVAAHLQQVGAGGSDDVAGVLLEEAGEFQLVHHLAVDAGPGLPLD